MSSSHSVAKLTNVSKKHALLYSFIIWSTEFKKPKCSDVDRYKQDNNYKIRKFNHTFSQDQNQILYLCFVWLLLYTTNIDAETWIRQQLLYKNYILNIKLYLLPKNFNFLMLPLEALSSKTKYRKLVYTKCLH